MAEIPIPSLLSKVPVFAMSTDEFLSRSREETVRWPVILWLSAASFAFAFLLELSGAINDFELKIYDYLTFYAAEEKKNDSIIIIKFDQPSVDALKNIGLSFPWPRDIYEPVLRHLADAKAVFIDIIFSEPYMGDRNVDFIFRDAISDAGNVYLALPLETRNKKKDENDIKFLSGISVKGNYPVKQNFSSAVLPAEDLRKGLKGAGNVTLNPDRDSIYRRMPLFSGIGNLKIPQFAVSAFINEGRIAEKNGKVFVDDVEIPMEKGEYLISYGKNQKPFEEISFIDIFNASFSEESGKQQKYTREYFKNKYILIGYTLKGLYDLRATPVSSLTPGVFIHATVIDNLIEKKFISPVNKPVIYFSMLLVSFITVWFVVKTRSMIQNMFYLVLLSAVFVLLSAFLFRLRIYFALLGQLTGLMTSFLSAAIFSYASEGRRRAFIRSTFTRYMDRKIVDHLLADPGLVSPGGSKRRCTVFFADIAGFTTISEKISPEQTAGMLYLVLTAMTELIISHDGVIDKYIGDCIMAFWGAPVSGENDERNAVTAAAACFDALGPINRELSEKGIPEISMRFGINTGDVIVGNLGSERLFDYTVIGDNVNLASRLESVNKVFGTHIIISEDTGEKLGDDFCLRFLGDIAVKGKSKSIKIYEVAGFKKDISEEKLFILDNYTKAVELFYGKNFEAAKKAFSSILEKWPDDGPSDYFLKRCNKFITQIPEHEGWEIIKMETK